MRRTKIVATVGPASDSADILRAMIRAGVNVFRLNFSHGSAEEHKARCEMLRALAHEEGCYVAILGDLQMAPRFGLRKLAGDAVDILEGRMSCGWIPSWPMAKVIASILGLITNRWQGPWRRVIPC